MNKLLSVGVVLALQLVFSNNLMASLTNPSNEDSTPPVTTTAAQKPLIDQGGLVDLFREAKIARLSSLDDELINMGKACEAFEKLVWASPSNEQRTLIFLGMIFGVHAGDYETFKVDVLPFLPTPWSVQDYLNRIKDPRYALCLSTKAGGKFHVTANDITKTHRAYNNFSLMFNDRELPFVPRRLDKMHEWGVLQLNDNNIRFLPDMTPWKHLRELHLNDNELTSLKPIAEMTRLEKLYIGNNKIEDLGPLSKLRFFTTLVAFSNPIRSLKPLLSCTDLETLHLGNLYDEKGRIPIDWANLEQLPGLSTLGLDHNEISDFKPLISLFKKLTRLIVLQLQRNKIEDIILFSHPRLSVINLTANPLKSIVPLRGLNLQKLDVDPGPLVGPKNLAELKAYVVPAIAPQVAVPAAPTSTTETASKSDKHKKKKSKKREAAGTNRNTPKASIAAKPVSQSNSQVKAPDSADLPPFYPSVTTHPFTIDGRTTIDDLEPTPDGEAATPLLSGKNKPSLSTRLKEAIGSFKVAVPDTYG